MKSLKLYRPNFGMLIGILLAANLAGCGVATNNSDPNDAQVRQNKLIEDYYGPLVGTYTCKITNTDHGDEDATLIVYITGVPATNPDGTPATKKVPMAILSRIHPVVADYQLSVSGYSPEHGQFNLTGTSSGAKQGSNSSDNSNDSSSASAESFSNFSGSIIGKMLARKYSGTINSNATGKIGDLNCEWSSDETRVLEPIKERLLRAYRTLSGTYVGLIALPDGTGKKIPVSVDLSVVVINDIPSFIGFYDRLDLGEERGDLKLTVSILLDRFPAQITMNGKGLGSNQINMDGTVSNDGTMFLEVVSQHSGYMGQFNGVRK